MSNNTQELYDDMMSDTYEALCDEGRTEVVVLDRNKWRIGDLASKASREFKNISVADYAREINLHSKTLYSYRQVAEFYSFSLRREFADSNLSYSHFKDAMRWKDTSKAMKWLWRVSNEGWSCDEASVQLSNILHDIFDNDAENIEPLTDDEIDGLRSKFKTGLIARLIATIDFMQLKVTT